MLGYQGVLTASRRRVLEAIDEYHSQAQQELGQLESENEHLRVQLARISAELALLRIAQREQGTRAHAMAEIGDIDGVRLQQRAHAGGSLFHFWRWVIGREFHDAEWQQRDRDTRQ